MVLDPRRKRQKQSRVESRASIIPRGGRVYKKVDSIQ